MTSRTLSPRTLTILDGVERAGIAGLYIWLVLRFFGSLSEQPANLIFLASEGLVACMILLRRPTTDISTRPQDWFTGFLGCVFPMLVIPAGGGWSGGAVLMLLGLIISVGAKLSLRRSFGVVAANRGVKSGGLYGLVLRPMYLGYFLINAGVLILNPSPWNGLVLTLWAVFQILRIQAEERVLLADPVYNPHAANVRWRLVPYLY